jgi:hypothetical protein
MAGFLRGPLRREAEDMPKWRGHHAKPSLVRLGLNDRVCAKTGMQGQAVSDPLAIHKQPQELPAADVIV